MPFMNPIKESPNSIAVSIGDLTGMTEGAVPFGEAGGGGLAQDATNFFWDDTNNRLGLGTNAPSNRLDIRGTLASAGSTTLSLRDTAGTQVCRVQTLSGVCAISNNLDQIANTQDDGTAPSWVYNLNSTADQCVIGRTPVGSTTIAEILDIRPAGLTINQVVNTSGSPTALRLNGAAHTTLTASVEASDVFLNLFRSVEFSTGAITEQRAIRVAAPEYTFVGPSTITTATTLDIDSPPIAGANATIVTAWVIRAAADTDANFAFGRLRLRSVSGDTATLSHFDMTTSSNYSMSIQSDGTTQLNSPTTLRFENSGTVVGFIDGTGMSIGSSTLTAPNARLHVRQPISTTGTPVELLEVTGAAHTTLAASTEASDVLFDLSRTVQFSTGALTAQRAFRIEAPTYGFVGSSIVTYTTTLHIDGPPVEGPNAEFVVTSGLGIGMSTTMDAGASKTVTGIWVAANGVATVTLVGGTAHTASPGVAGIVISNITVTDGDAVTVSNAAALYIENAPTAGGSVTITNRYSIWCDDGKARFDGDGTHVFELPADATDPTGGGGAATGRIPTLIGGALRYLAYY